MPTTFVPVNINAPLGRIEHLAAGSRIGDDVLDTEALVLPGDDVADLTFHLTLLRATDNPRSASGRGVRPRR
jgi:hypothetical protein